MSCGSLGAKLFMTVFTKRLEPANQMYEEGSLNSQVILLRGQARNPLVTSGVCPFISASTKDMPPPRENYLATWTQVPALGCRLSIGGA